MGDNLLLTALPREERARLDRFLEPVSLENHDILIEANEPITNTYFPYDCVTSTIQELGDGSMIEVGLMGVEGFIGVQFWLNMPSTPTRTLIQIPGRAYRMSSADFLREVMQTPSPLNNLVARYTHSFLAMTSLVAACNRLHTIDERLCRWLKMCHDRMRRNEFPLRQEFMAQMLGVHRPSVSVAAGILQKAGLISYHRGQMHILDPEGLREGACECYELMQEQINRIFDRPWQELIQEQDQQ